MNFNVDVEKLKKEIALLIAMIYLIHLNAMWIT